MLVLISPAKTLDFTSPVASSLATEPDFLAESRKLVKTMRQMSPQDIAELMGISAKLADLNHQRFMDWKTPFTPDNSKQAVMAFKGDVYTGLEADTLSATDLKFAQKHLRILSGLYGVLRPMDLIQPYRLEMGIKLANPRGDNLYQFWGERITKALNEQLQASRSKVVVNLASNEYYKSVQQDKLNAEVITPVFKDLKNGKYKIISFYAKKARGVMSKYIIRQRIKKPAELQDFAEQGYYFSAEDSTHDQWVFLRDQPPAN